jgi:two-component system, OmpR family, phosphate regulon sensor histidine kinase PhoR
MDNRAATDRLIARAQASAAACAVLGAIALVCALVGWTLAAVAFSVFVVAFGVLGWEASVTLRRPSPATDSTAATAAGGRLEEPSFGELSPLLEALPDPAMLVDREGRVAGSNRAARQALQFEAAGLRLSAIIRRPEVLDAAVAAAQDGASRTVDYGTTGHVEEHFRCYAAPVSWGARSAALLVFHDQTAQMTTERARADFLANASHELRTPLASLLLIVETLSGPAREDAAARDRFLGMMYAQADRMRRLINDLLSLSRIELDEHVPPSDMTDLMVVAQEAIDALAPVSAERAVSVILQADETTPAQVVGDRFQLVQVAQNLIANAIKYSPENGVVTVELGQALGREEALERCNRLWEDAGRISLLTPPPSGKPFTYLRIADTGVGIARRHLPRLAERFYRVERAEGAEQNGTGLGLAIVKHIMNRHRGGFAVESAPGQGSAFAVYLESATVAGEAAA